MSEIGNGGPAFPVNEQRFLDGVINIYASEGMTLRDWFAGRAMQAVPMSENHLHDIPEAYDRIAQHAYKMADAMLRARSAK